MKVRITMMTLFLALFSSRSVLDSFELHSSSNCNNNIKMKKEMALSEESSYFNRITKQIDIMMNAEIRDRNLQDDACDPELNTVIDCFAAEDPGCNATCFVDVGNTYLDANGDSFSCT
jgi:hypothetical protein